MSSYVASGSVLCTKSTLSVSDIQALDPRGETPEVTVSGTNITVTFRAKQIVKTPITSLSEITDAKGIDVLTQDINASGASIINGFKGTLDGQFYKITRLTHATVDMTQMGLVTGAITTTVSGGTVGANVFGGGNQADVTGKTNVTVGKQ